MKNKRQITLNSVLLCFAFILPFITHAQPQIFKGNFYDAKEDIHLKLDLYDQTLEVPDMEFIGKVNGYLHGNIYGVWLLTKFKVSENVATLRFSHDSGADAQSVELTLVNDSTILYRALNGNAIRRVQKRKLVKIPNELKFIRKE